MDIARDEYLGRNILRVPWISAHGTGVFVGNPGCNAAGTELVGAPVYSNERFSGDIVNGGVRSDYDDLLTANGAIHDFVGGGHRVDVL